MAEHPMAPTCDYRCPEPKGTCFPAPCKRSQPALEAANWHLRQCRKAVIEGEVELEKRREALRQAIIAHDQVKQASNPGQPGER